MNTAAVPLGRGAVREKIRDKKMGKSLAGSSLCRAPTRGLAEKPCPFPVR